MLTTKLIKKATGDIISISLVLYNSTVLRNVILHHIFHCCLRFAHVNNIMNINSNPYVNVIKGGKAMYSYALQECQFLKFEIVLAQSNNNSFAVTWQQ